MSIPATSPCVTASALDCAHTRARGRVWIADFDTDPKSTVEEVGLLILAFVHRTQGALTCGRVLGNASDFFTGDSAQDGGFSIETMGHEGIRVEGSGVEAVDLEGTGVEGVDLGGARRDVRNAPRTLCMPTMPVVSLTIQRWHTSSWEVGYSPGIREAQGCGEALQGLSEAFLRGHGVLRGVGDGDRQEWTRSEDPPRIPIADSSVEEERLFLSVEEGVQVILDYCEDEGDREVLNSGFLVDRTPRAGRHTQALTGTPGPPLCDVTPTLKGVMGHLLDSSPVTRSLQVHASLFVGQGEEKETITLHSARGATIAREPCGTGALWRTGSVMDSATGRDLLNLIGACARV